MKRVPSKQQNSRIHRDRDPRALSRLALLLFSGLILAGGFVLAARQHFVAVQFGYKTEALRRERERLLEERQHLTLQREQAVAPARLQSEARNLGLQPLLAGQVGVPRQSRLPVTTALLNPSAALQR